MALIGPNIGIAVWNEQTDHYNHDQLADNFMKVEFHDHSPGRGMQIPTEGLQDGAVTAAKLAPGSNAIEDASITTAKIALLPKVKAYSSIQTSCANNVWTDLPFDLERYDSAGSMHSTSTATNLLVAPVAGTYHITVSVQCSSTPIPTTGQFQLAIYKNGITYGLAKGNLPANATAGTLSATAQLAFQDNVRVQAFNSTGGAIVISAGGATSESVNDFGMVWVAP